MIRLAIKDILNAVVGHLITGNENVFINGVSTDSRTIKSGELFFALEGPRFDGHRFVQDVLRKGAAGAVVNSKFKAQSSKFSIVQVEDTLKALGDLAAYWRKKHRIPLVAVSGSCGKTTTKEMIASILKTSRCVLKTEGNLNNLIGLPLTLFSLNNIHKAVVVELGISEKGEMKRLAEICKPDVAVLTNIGEAHTDAMGNIEGVASAKGELFQHIGNNGAAVINIDDPWLLKMGDSIAARKITFSLKTKADVMLKDCGADFKSVRSTDEISATFLSMGEEIPVKMKYTGIHNLSNAAAAIAATLPLGATSEEIISGLEHTEPVPGRMEVITSEKGFTIIDDTYNANPVSMEAALKTLASMKGRKIAVLGDMLELGDIAQEAHKRIGRLVQEMGIDMLFVMGDFRKDFIKGAMDAGMASDTIYEAMDKNSLIKTLARIVKKGDAVLVKGSRAMTMEEVVQKLMSNIKAQSSND
ncbi:MAG: UDP-N-acetylmuramoyl-tripeptide--D-alanyl-D-alanine ligase [Deltaproteobacteria bacterium]|nr:UDP-N-acetylmuramoyl-tripeptide--D-alanyl-D-alanine ligase [Deltaproteobacteria bacterium]